MNSQIKQRWVKALRSNQYKQSRDKLYSDRGYCCLGVLCDLYSQDQGDKWILSIDGQTFQMSGSAYQLPHNVMNWAGLSTRNPRIQTEEYGTVTLSEYNDFGFDFKEIAQLIEEQL